MRISKLINYLELAIARKLTTVTCILANAQRQAEEWQSFTGEGRGGHRRALIGGCWQGVL